jgi:hypothetical protein
MFNGKGSHVRNLKLMVKAKQAAIDALLQKMPELAGLAVEAEKAICGDSPAIVRKPATFCKNISTGMVERARRGKRSKSHLYGTMQGNDFVPFPTQEHLSAPEVAPAPEVQKQPEVAVAQ